MIFGAMSDKPSGEMLHVLSPRVRRWIFTRPENPRARDPDELAKQTPGSVISSDVHHAIDYARGNAPAGATVVICGSLYLIGEALDVLH